MNKGNGNKVYHQPPPRRNGRPPQGRPRPPQGYGQSKQGNQPPRQPQQRTPLHREVGILFIRGANMLGELIISDRFVNIIQRIFQEHLDFLNYILRNLHSSSFWKLNLKYSIILAIVFLLKGIFSKTFVTFEVFVVIGTISFFTLKILNSKGDVIEVTPAKSHYNEDVTNKIREEPVVTKEDTSTTPVREEEVTKEKPGGLRFEEEQPPDEDILDTIKAMHKSVSSKRSNELDRDLLNEALDKMPEVRQRIQFNGLSQQLQDRALLNEAMNPLKDLVAGKGVEGNGDKFKELLREISGG